MTTTMISLGGLALLALLGYLSATGRVADSRDGRDWRRGFAPAVRTASRTSRDAPGESGGRDQDSVARRAFASDQVELIAVAGDRRGRDGVLVSD